MSEKNVRGPNGERWRLSAEFRGLVTRKWHPCVCWFARGEDCDAMGKRWEEQAKRGNVRRIDVALADKPAPLRVTVVWRVKAIDKTIKGQARVYYAGKRGAALYVEDAALFLTIGAARDELKTWPKVKGRRVFIVRVTRPVRP